MLIHEFDQQAAADEADEGEWPEWLVQVAPCTHSDGAAIATVVSCASDSVLVAHCKSRNLVLELTRIEFHGNSHTCDFFGLLMGHKKNSSHTKSQKNIELNDGPKRVD